MKRSTIGWQAMAGLSLKMLRHPWIAGRLAGLQTTKYLFNAFHVRREEGRGRKIRHLSLRVTDRRNLRCATRGQRGEGGFTHGKNIEQCIREEVAPERHIDVSRDLYGHGHRPVVYLWGGEPMLYKGAPDIIGAAAARHLPVAIATNETRIAAAARRLVEAPLFLFRISIDGQRRDRPCPAQGRDGHGRRDHRTRRSRRHRRGLRTSRRHSRHGETLLGHEKSRL